MSSAKNASESLGGVQAAYERFLPSAQALNQEEVVPFRADASLAYHNVVVGVEAVLALEGRVKEELPKADLAAIKRMPELALAVVYAASQVSDTRSVGRIGRLISEAYPLREKMLAAADALAKSALLPAGAVRKIQQGIGGIDAAADLVSLANLFDKNARKLRGKSPIGAAEVKRAAELGSELLSLLRPKGAKPATDVERQKAVEVRNRLWTLLVRHHEHLRRVAMWLWGDAAGGHVPALQARVTGQRRRPPSDAASTAPAAPA